MDVCAPSVSDVAESGRGRITNVEGKVWIGRGFATGRRRRNAVGGILGTLLFVVCLTHNSLFFITCKMKKNKWRDRQKLVLPATPLQKKIKIMKKGLKKKNKILIKQKLLKPLMSNTHWICR